ncbi:MAG: HYR domain-containing protein [Saprospiraceae bacterium]|nr:HYR domain-containing protein [Saprospiraceae bacterium]
MLSVAAPGNYTWGLDGNPFGVGPTITASIGGTYSATIMAANGCTATSFVVVTFTPDNTPPTITCPATQTLVLGANCTANLPNYTSLATTSDNCGVQNVTQSPIAGTTVSAPGNMMVTLTVTDINGLTNTCSFTVSKVDNTPPSITCPTIQTLVLGASCTATLPNYTTLATAGDNCGVQGVTQSPIAGTTVSGAGNMTVTLTVTDINGLTNTCSFTVSKVDNTPPSITCPTTQTLVLGASCTATLPNYTTLATTGDNCGVQGVTQSPAAGTTVSGAGNMTVTLTSTDSSGLTNTCSFTVSKVDNTPPSITCPTTQTLVLGASCTATLPNYTTLATTGDNCGVQGVTQSPAVGTTVSGAGNMMVTLTVTDINGLTNACSFTVSKVDNTPPNITCPATQNLVLGASCTAALPNYTTLAVTSDNCGVQSVTQSPAAGTTVSGAGNMTVSLTVSDANGLLGSCSFLVVKVDNTPPMLSCFNQTIIFNGEPSIALDPDDLVDATDNCGIQSISLSPNSISSSQVGQIIPVLVTVTDVNGNSDNCTSLITVSGLPSGWSQNINGVACANGNNIAYNASTEVWTATSTNCYYSSPFTSDAMGFGQRTLCGNGSITAQVTGISGTALGWAGIVMRESNAPGAKKVQLMTNLSNFLRREVRSVTNGPAVPQQFQAFNRYWLRLTRTGSQIVAHSSSDGINWVQVLAITLPMNSCIEMGLVVTNYSQNSTVTATFDNVSYIGNGPSPMYTIPGEGVIESEEQYQPDFSVYPNPTSGELNMDLQEYLGKNVQIELYSLEGKLMQLIQLDEVLQNSQTILLDKYASGMYFVKLKSAGLPDVTKRVVLTKG